jgi:Tol biopolymer transport system component
MSSSRARRGALVLAPFVIAAGIGLLSPAAHAAIQPVSTALLPNTPPRGPASVSKDGRHILFDDGTRYSVASGGPSGGSVSSSGVVGMSSDGRWVATVSSDLNRSLSVATAFGSDRQTLGYSVNDASLSSDGSRVAFVEDPDGTAHASVWSRETGQLVKIDDGLSRTNMNSGARSVSVSADGRFVAYLYVDFIAGCPTAGTSICQFDAWRYDTVTGARVRISADAGGSRLSTGIGPPALSGDGKVATFLARQFDLTDPVHVYRKNLVSGELREIASYPYSDYTRLAPPTISDDGDRIAYAGLVDDRGGDPSSYVYERSSDSTVRLTDKSLFSPLISGDGTTVIYGELGPNAFEPRSMIARFPGAGSAPVAAVPAKTSMTVPLTGIPDGAKAAVLNVTIVGPEAAGYATVWPCDEPRPNTSNLNFLAGQTVPNVVIMKPSAANTLCVYTDASADVLVDVSGYLSASNSFVGQNPSRLLDTRDVNPAPGLGVGGVATVGPFPAEADSVVLNVTATNAAAAGFVTAWPCDQPQPNASSVNFVPRTAVPNQVIAKTSADHTVCLYTDQPVDLIADFSGWFPAGNGYQGLTPSRLFDSRKTGSGPQLAEVTAVIADPRVPADAEAVVLNLTGTGPKAPGFGTAFSCSESQPNTSNLNFVAGQTVPNLVITKPSSVRTTCLFSSTPIDYIVDSSGYFPAGSGFVAVTPLRIVDTRDT